jgi:hypothetical protein
MAMVDEKWGRNQQVAAYDSSYNQHQDGLYNEMNSWVVVRTMCQRRL